MKLDNYKCEGQLSIFDYLKAADPEPEKPKHIPPIYEYLRYGPHTLIPEVREETKAYLEKYGVPSDWEKWDKNSLACSNCTWFDGKNCRGGGHTCHYEFGFLVCDNFNQSITERTPRTVGDAYPSKFKEIQKELREEEKASKAADPEPKEEPRQLNNEQSKICQYSQHTCNRANLWEVADTLDDVNCPHSCCRICAVNSCGARCNGSEEPPRQQDEYIKENPTCFYVLGHYLDRADGWHKVPEELPMFTPWQKVDVVLFGKKTGAAWMEHEKWEAKDWTFRSLDENRRTESTVVLAWKLST